MIDLIICAHNAGSSLGTVLAGLPLRRLRSVVVVDNNSEDGTAHVARDAGAQVLREPRVGYGAACQRAIRHLAGLPRPPDAVAFLSADGSDDPAELAALIEPLARDNAELVVGVRHHADSGQPAPGVASRLALKLISTIYRHHFEDLGPMRVIRFPALVALAMADRGQGWHVEMLVKAVKLGLQIVEVPVTAGVAQSAPRQGARELIDSVGTTGRVLFRILRNATAR